MCVRVRCPKCNARKYQCRLCVYSSVYKQHAIRHIKNIHDLPQHSSPNALDMGDDDGTSVSFRNDDDYDDGSFSSIEDEASVERDEFLINLINPENDSEENSISQDDTSTHTNELHFSYESTSNNLNILPLSQFTFADNSKSRIYFWQDYVHLKSSGELLGGIKGVAWRSINQTLTYKENDILQASDAKLMFLFADHALNNCGKQQKVFFQIIDGLVQRLRQTTNSLDTFIECLDDEQKQSFDSIVSSMNEEQTKIFKAMKPSVKLSIKAPTNTTEANALLLQGKYSIFANIPSAAVRILADHAVVSLDSLFDHIVAQGIPIDENGVVNNNTLNGSPAANEIYDEFQAEVADPNNTALALFMKWSDGFVRVYVKQKKNSAWMMTVAFPNPAGNATSIFHTYCIAIGNSSSNHTPVLEYFLRELDVVKREKIRYCGRTNKFIKTSFRMMAYSSDRIERADLLKTSQGGTYGSRSHFAGAVDPDVFPFCDQCFNTLIQSLRHSEYPAFPVNDDLCQRCCRWDSSSASAAATTIPLPTKYPRHASATSPPAPVNRTLHETCIISTRQEFSWLKAGVEYTHYNLATNEQDADGKKIRWNKDESTAYLRSMAINESVQEAVYQSAKAKRKRPQYPIVEFIPALWKTKYPMERFLTSPMHLLFHGLVAAVMELLHKFMLLISKLATFERLVNVYLTKIESLRLDWLKLRELPKTKWLAENLLGMARILPAVYGMFFTNFTVPPIYSCAAQSLKQTINSMHVLISALMSSRCSFEHSRKIDIYIKIFLSCVHRSAKLVLGNVEGNAWLTNKANPVSLLNLTRQIEHFGPVRWYYEGVCERYIQVVKPYLVKNMRRTPSYFQQKLILIHKMVFMKWLAKAFDEEETETEDDSQRQYKGYYRYRSVDFVKEEFDHGSPIACFKLDTGPPQLSWIAYGKPKEPSLIPVIAANGSVENCCGFYFSRFTLLEDKCLQQSKSELDEHIKCHGLLFPFVRPGNEPFDHKFTAVFDDWDVLTQGRAKGESLIDRQLYN
jgi:hypothetical protein